MLDCFYGAGDFSQFALELLLPHGLIFCGTGLKELHPIHPLDAVQKLTNRVLPFGLGCSLWPLFACHKHSCVNSWGPVLLGPLLAKDCAWPYGPCAVPVFRPCYQKTRLLAHGLWNPSS